jgi:1,4-alpha-glucan branching enzyme
MIFQGQEFLESGHFADSDPLDWSKDTTYSKIKLLYTDLIGLRKNAGNNTKGLTGNNTNVYHINNTSGKVIGMRRWYNGGTGDDVVVIMNFENHTYTSYNIGFPSTGTWQVRFNSDATRYSTDYTNVGGTSVTAVSGTKDGLPANGNVALGPYSALILSK